jgi:hypothetical protein
VGAVFVESVVQLMLAHMTCSVFAPHKRWLLLPFALGVCVTLLSDEKGGYAQAALVWRWLFVGVGSYTALFLVNLIMQLCLILDVRCFRIRKPKVEEATNGHAKH